MSRKIGIIFGMENTFPPALVEKINSMQAHDVTAEFVKIGGTRMAEPTDYKVIIDRISHEIPYYRTYLKNAMLAGAYVINNPFWWAADDKFFDNTLATKLGVAVPKTVVLPSNQHPPNTTAESMRNLIYPMEWDKMFEYVGFPAFFKPHDGGGWKNVFKVHSPEEFFYRYNNSGQQCMMLQEAIEFEEYYRCYCVGRKNVHIMRYAPDQPHHLRYSASGINPSPIKPELEERMRNDVITLCTALGYDLNTVEFAVRGDVPYAIDFMNPAPDADYYSVTPPNFEWIVNAMAEFAIEKALDDTPMLADTQWADFLGWRQSTRAQSSKRKSSAKQPSKSSFGLLETLFRKRG
jgi:glutathione synthase/RimK-type ligase-like ATP-grasp enzyme